MLTTDLDKFILYCGAISFSLETKVVDFNGHQGSDCEIICYMPTKVTKFFIVFRHFIGT